MGKQMWPATRSTHVSGAKCGVEGGRTPDPRLAKPVLYQLSYNPVYSAEEVIRNKEVGLVFAGY